MIYSGVVKMLWYIVGLTLLAAWLPATSHCLLGSVGAMADTCCEDAHGHEGEPEPAQSHDDCGTCSNIESGDYQLRARNHFTLAFQATLTWGLELSATPTTTPNAAWHIASRAPPDLAVRWQFLTRAAIPGRAPAIL